MDEKIIAIPFSDPTYNSFRSIFELPAHITSEMRHFFSVYKNLENKGTVVDDEQDVEAAKLTIRNAIAQYKKVFTNDPSL